MVSKERMEYLDGVLDSLQTPEEMIYLVNRIDSVGARFCAEEPSDADKELVRSWLVSEEMQGANTDNFAVEVYCVEKSVQSTSMPLKTYLNLDGYISDDEMESLAEGILNDAVYFDCERLYEEAAVRMPYDHPRKMPKNVADALKRMRNEHVASFTSVYKHHVEE